MRAIVLSMLFVIACGGEDPPPRETSEPRLPIAASRAVAGPAGFAIVPSDDGALLAWSHDGVLHAQALGAHGEEAGSRITISRAAAVELEAAALGRRVGVAWITDASAVASAFSSDGGHTFAAPVPLDASVPSRAGARGRLAVASNDEGRLTLFHRVSESECVGAETGTCARIARHGIGAALPSTERGMEILEVRHPCDPLVSGTRWHAGTWYYAICDREHTTIYAIRDELQWAAPVEVPCAPAGIAPLDHGVAALTRCADGSTVAHVLDQMGGEMARLTSPERTASCADGRPTLRLGQDHTLRLAEAIDHIEGLLPESIAPRGARAIWTGESVLVARALGSTLSIHRYECTRGDRFSRTDSH